MEESEQIRVSKIAEDIVNLVIPEIDVKNYPIWRRDDIESDGELFQRAAEFAVELLRRYNAGEIYCVGYRQWKDGKIHLVLRRTTDSGNTILQRVLGVDDDFTPIS